MSVLIASEMTYTVSGGALNSTQSSLSTHLVVRVTSSKTVKAPLLKIGSG